MDFLSKHFEGHRRRFAGPSPVSGVGFMPGKESRVRHTFETVNFSFILEGNGTYLWRDRMLRIESPAVIQQFPGVAMDYGPEAGKVWTEVYLVFPATELRALRARNLCDPERPWWPIGDAERVRAAVAELEAAARTESPVVDRIDRIAERMILESLLIPHSEGNTPEERAVRRIQALLRADPAHRHDLERLAQRQGLSVTSFRRHWLSIVGLPPARWLRQVRIREACRLLAETRLPIGEIARRVGFDDELYFSRRFHADRGLTASTYRKVYAAAHLNSRTGLDGPLRRCTPVQT